MTTVSKLYKTTMGGKTIYVGDINENIYTRKVKWSHKHEDNLTGETGWTIDKDTCQQHIFPRCNYIVIRCTDKEQAYQTSTHHFMQKARELRDRYFLGMSEWEVSTDRRAFKKIEVVEVI